MKRNGLLIYKTSICCVLSGIIYSCSVPGKIKSNFTYCYDGKLTGIEKLLDIDGYYKMGQLYDEYGRNAVFVHRIVTFYSYFMFYRDGTFLDLYADTSGNAHDYFQKVKNDKKEKKHFERSYNWGRYIIAGDTVKVQWINHPEPLAPTWMAYEEWYKIIDRKTLRYIKAEPVAPMNDREYEIFKKNDLNQKNLDAEFVPEELKPDSSCWLKEKKWFWCSSKGSEKAGTKE